MRLAPPVARDEIPALLGSADALVSATEPRGAETLDKVVYEAAACGVPVVSSNAALDEFLVGLPVELRFPARDAGARARCSRALRRRPEARVPAGAALRLRVVEGHSVESWADAVAGIVGADGPSNSTAVSRSSPPSRPLDLRATATSAPPGR